MIPIDNPIVPGEAKDLIEYVETAFNFTVVAYSSHIGDERPTTGFFITYPDIRKRVGGNQGFYRDYAYYAYNTTGLTTLRFTTFEIENGLENIDYFLEKLIKVLSGIVLVTPFIYDKKETTTTLPKFSSLVELKMKMNLKGIC